VIDLKIYRFSLDIYQLDWAFSAIRSKRDVILLLMRSIKVMMLPIMEPEVTTGVMTLQISKMSRLFFSSANKVFSVNFPFTAIEQDDCLRFRSIHHSDINGALTSNIISILESTTSLEAREVLEFADPIFSQADSDPDFWCLFRDLLMSEDGYVRYDHDDIRNNGNLHPVDHLDIFYSSANTFKLGLGGRISADILTDMLNLTSDCHFIEIS
jgi:hypothetical protein